MSEFKSDVPSLVDKFGFDQHASGLADRIASKIKNTSDGDNGGFVIALQGGWGTGKSTFLNFLRGHLDQHKADGQFVVVDFDPWWLSGGTPLTLAFFRTLLGELPEGVRNSLTGVVKTLGSATQFIPDWLVDLAGGEDGKMLGKALAALKESGGDIEGYLAKGVSPRKARDRVAKAINEAKIGVVVIIDDVDRLHADELLEVIRFLKSVGDLPRMVYVLSMDREMVCRLLKDGRISEPDQYLEKIIQTAFDLPAPAKWQLVETLITDLISMFGDILPSDFHSDRRFNWIVCEYIDKPRDISRLLNALTLNFRILSEDVDVVDFLCIETIRVLDYEFYRAARESKWALTHEFPEAEEAAVIARLLKQEGAPVEERRIRGARTRAVGLLFPISNFSVTREFKKKDHSERELQFRKRVGSGQFFDAYFRFEPSPSTLPAKKIEEVLLIGSSADLLAKLRVFNQVAADHYSPIDHFLEYMLGATLQKPAAVSFEQVVRVVRLFNDAIAPEGRGWLLNRRATLCAQMVCQASRSVEKKIADEALGELLQPGSESVFVMIAANKKLGREMPSRRDTLIADAFPASDEVIHGLFKNWAQSLAVLLPLRNRTPSPCLNGLR